MNEEILNRFFYKKVRHLFGQVASPEQMSNFFAEDLERLLNIPINHNAILKVDI